MIPEGVTALDTKIFKDNTSITSVRIPDSVTSLNGQQFFGATSLTKVWLPDNLSDITALTFYNVNATFYAHLGSSTAKALSLRSKPFTEEETGSVYRYILSRIDNVTGIRIVYIPDGEEQELTIPETIGGTPVKELLSGAYLDHASLVKVHIPGTVTTIAADAFAEGVTLVSTHDAYARTWADANGFAWEHDQHTPIGLPAVSATCEQDGLTEDFFNAAFTAQTKTVADIPALGHEWGEVSYTWSEDNTTVTAERICQHDTEHKETETVVVTAEVTKVATCEAVGEHTYSGADFDNTAFTAQTKTMADIPALGHEWSEETYSWNSENSKVTATRICAHDKGHVETETVTATSEITKVATCEGKGETTYTSAAFENTAFTAQTKTVDDVPALGHEWGETIYTWNSDSSKVTATRVCSHDAEHVESEEVETNKELVAAPTDKVAGAYQIVSKAFENTAFEIQIKSDLNIPALEDMSVLKLPAFLKTIETEAFEGIAAEAIIIPDGCTTIEPMAFINCRNLLYIRVPAGIELPENTFAGCPNVVVDQE